MRQAFLFVDQDSAESCACSNCGMVWKPGDLAPIQDIGERISAGETVPAGQCPDCGALCHLKEDKPKDIEQGIPHVIYITDRQVNAIMPYAQLVQNLELHQDNEVIGEAIRTSLIDLAVKFDANKFWCGNVGDSEVVVIDYDIVNSLMGCGISERARECVALVELFAGFTKDGELLGGEPFEMENDDAYETLHDVISMSRALFPHTLETGVKDPVMVGESFVTGERITISDPKGIMSRPMADINTPPGHFVTFAYPDSGYPHHQETAAKYLKVGDHYRVERTDVGEFHTDFFLEAFPGVAFNSVHFAPYDDS